MPKHPGELSLDDDTPPAKKPNTRFDSPISDHPLSLTPTLNLSTENQDRVPCPMFTAWSTPFIGTAHDVLANNIQNMYETAVNWATRDSDRRYGTHASIIQGSGSGKSRLVHELADKTFTIPFNVRDPHDATSGAWPPADDEIRELLAVFEETRKAVEQSFPQTPRAELASTWREYLAEKKNRDALYAKVVISALTKAQEQSIRNPLQEAEMATIHASLRETAKRALDKLVHSVCAEPDCSSHSDNPVQKLHLLISFDGAHVLAKQLGQLNSSHSEGTLAPLDILFDVLEEFLRGGLFAVFISSHSDIESPTPPSSGSTSGSAHRRNPTEIMHAPITETPFDCFGPLPIIPSRLHAEDVSDVVFMACLGRPLWRTLLLEFTDQVVERCTGYRALSASGTPQIPAPSSNLADRAQQCADLVTLARSKLVCQSGLDEKVAEYPRAAQTAVLDVRIMLPFHPHSSAALLRQRELVASHMRIVYSIPRPCKTLRSGYSTEPILAEAAAHQLHAWRTHESTDSEPAALILEHHLDDDLLDPDQIRQAVGRLLLVLARDRAVVTTFADDATNQPVFSRAVPVNAFIKELFPPNLAQRVLESVPDNLPADSEAPPSRTFEEAFEDAVLNFTHFGEWADSDESPPNECAAIGCFVRSMAAICRDKHALVDVFLPVLMKRSAPLRPEVMSGILVQFRQRKVGSTQAAYEVDQRAVGLFRPRPRPRRLAVDGETLRPYVSLFMELEATRLPEPLRAHPPVADSGSAAIPDQQLDQSRPPVDNNSDSPGAQSIPPDLAGGAPPTPSRARVRGVHPRYSLYAYGCSPSVYRVVRGEGDSVIYKKAIRSGDVLAEHTVHKPFSYAENASWNWLAIDGLNPGPAGAQSESSESPGGESDSSEADSEAGGVVVLLSARHGQGDSDPEDGGDDEEGER
ncbi:hypothetical protein LXA43DRAFT_1181412 [Ganoderma leucocontextum]|nr:hypothetical protein LXA43DRAFT_1181412 [Ganoderma leucocontextum]